MNKIVNLTNLMLNAISAVWIVCHRVIKVTTCSSP